MGITAPPSDGPGPHPEPPDDLTDRRLPLQTIGRPSAFIRVYRLDRAELEFSRSPAGRFNAPGGEYGVLYAGSDPHCAFIETFGRDLRHRLVAGVELKARALARIELRRRLRLVDLSGPGLATLGADGRLCTGDYAIAQRWSLALWRHPDQPDGLLWRSRFDPSRTCVAIYQRAGPPAVTARPLGGLMDPKHARLLTDLLNTYQFGLIA